MAPDGRCRAFLTASGRLGEHVRRAVYHARIRPWKATSRFVTHVLIRDAGFSLGRPLAKLQNPANGPCRASRAQQLNSPPYGMKTGYGPAACALS